MPMTMSRPWPWPWTWSWTMTMSMFMWHVDHVQRPKARPKVNKPKAKGQGMAMSDHGAVLWHVPVSVTEQYAGSR